MFSENEERILKIDASKNATHVDSSASMFNSSLAWGESPGNKVNLH